jgi:mRNA interferase MazF
MCASYGQPPVGGRSGNLFLPARTTGLPKDSVANVSRVTSLDRSLLTEPVGKLSRSKLQILLAGIGVVLGR